MMTLYEIKNEYRMMLDSVEINDDGEFVNANGEPMDNVLAMMDGAFEEKAEGYALYIKELSIMEDAIASEIKAMQGRKSAITRKIEWLKYNLSTAMIDTEKTKIETPKAKLSLRRTESVNVTCETYDLPVEYQRIKTSIEPDKTALKDALKAGKEIAGVSLIEKQSLIVK